MEYKIRKIIDSDFDGWLSVVHLLWPDATTIEMKDEFESALNENDKEIFVCLFKSEYIGFINISTRVDYVEGSESSPVGYIEGIYVQEGYRKIGIAKRLVDEAINFSKEKGKVERGVKTVSEKQSRQAFQ